MSASRALAGTLYDAQGNILRRGTDPRAGRARAFLSSMVGSYTGARSDKRALQEWSPGAASADTDTLGDLYTLRARSRDLERNAPLAAGAINTVITNAIGTGLWPQPRVDTEYLSEKYDISDAQADAFERAAARLWRYHSDGRYLDVAGLETHPQMQQKVLRGILTSGDIFALRRRKARPGAILQHCVQLIEADRVTNPYGEVDRTGFAAGVETNLDGEPQAYHVASRHPLDLFVQAPLVWTRVAARGAVSGERQVRHLAWRRRPSQTRGVPYLATVIEPLKQLDRYGEAELMAAVIGAMFTVFIKSDYGDDLLPPSPQSGQDLSGNKLPNNYRLGPGAILNLMPGEEIQLADMKRPSALFEPFVQAQLQMIGAALELPYEMLIKRFTSSYSASRASRLEAWKFLSVVRGFIAADFCQPDYEDLLTEAVALGEVDAPGFFEDPLARQAWLWCMWTGPSPGQINEKDEVAAATARIQAGLSTREAETAALTGGSFDRNHRQLTKERRMRVEAGLESDVAPLPMGTSAAPASTTSGDAASTRAPAPNDDTDDDTEDDTDDDTDAEATDAA